jgi:glycosyltransferase involved in cell wall biosynthesis
MAHVSVIIPTYNRAQKVLRAVSSVLYQTYEDFELIVVDDGSTDDTKERLAPFQGKIVYHSLPRNAGVSAARNAGIRLAQAPFLAFLDSDDYWFAEKLARQMAFFERNPQARICQTEERWIRRGRRVNPRTKHLKPTGDIFEPSLKICLVSPSSVMVTRSLLEEAGHFDEGLPACEDYDLWLRIACRVPVHLIREELVVKEGGHGDQLSARFSGMDRFRIRALIKLIRGDLLNGVQLEAALSELTTKCAIYGKGCLKRGKREEAKVYLEIPDRIKQKYRIHSPGKTTG